MFKDVNLAGKCTNLAEYLEKLPCGVQGVCFFQNWEYTEEDSP